MPPAAPELPPQAGSSPRSLLVVEDDAGLRTAIASALEAVSDRVRLVSTLAEATRACREDPPDLVLLDLQLPDGDGAALLYQLRSYSSAPLIVLSGDSADARKVALLDAGADDFVSKPCSMAELLARVRTQLRRAAGTRAPRGSLRVGDVEIDLQHRRVTRLGTAAHLTPTEWAVLDAFVRHAGRTLTVRQLWDMVWQREFGDHGLHVRVQITRLRRKIEPNPTAPSLIVTVPGIGYRFTAA